MTLNFDIGDGADALALNQLTGALNDTYVIDDFAPEKVDDTDFEVRVRVGEGVINGSYVDPSGGTILDLSDDVDPDNPTKVVLSVNEDADGVKTVGDPLPANPEGQTRSRTFEPMPPVDAPGLVVGEVWIPAGATEIQPEDIRDRRVFNIPASSTFEFEIRFDDEESRSGEYLVPFSNIETLVVDTSGLDTFEVEVFSESTGRESIDTFTEEGVYSLDNQMRYVEWSATAEDTFIAKRLTVTGIVG